MKFLDKHKTSKRKTKKNIDRYNRIRGFIENKYQYVLENQENIEKDLISFNLEAGDSVYFRGDLFHRGPKRNENAVDTR